MPKCIGLITTFLLNTLCTLQRALHRECLSAYQQNICLFSSADLFSLSLIYVTIIQILFFFFFSKQFTSLSDIYTPVLDPPVLRFFFSFGFYFFPSPNESHKNVQGLTELLTYICEDTKVPQRCFQFEVFICVYQSNSEIVWLYYVQLKTFIY